MVNIPKSKLQSCNSFRNASATNESEIGNFTWQGGYAAVMRPLIAKSLWPLCNLSLRSAELPPRWTDFDDLYVMWRLYTQECAFWVRIDTAPI